MIWMVYQLFDLWYFTQKFAQLNIDFDNVLAFEKEDNEDKGKVRFYE
jgi:hypothetical protein